MASKTDVRDLGVVLQEMEAFQEKTRGRALTEDEGKQFAALGAEAKACQDEAEREGLIASTRAQAKAQGRAVDPTLPGGPEAQAKDETAGLVTFGAFYTQSADYKAYVASGCPKMALAAGVTVDVQGKSRLVRIARGTPEAKALADLGAMIVPDRTGKVLDVDRPARLFLRDVVEKLNTGSNMVEYVEITYTEAAAGVVQPNLKPSAGLTSTVKVKPVRDLAVTADLTEQTLADAPQVTGILDGRMRRDLDKTEEFEMAWGDGTTLLGIFNTPGVGPINPARFEVGDTIIDKMRRMVTDVRTAEYNPDAFAVHPLDAEKVQLTKGEDGHYVYFVVTDPITGQLRIFGLQMIETPSMLNPDGSGERRILAGAFAEGATLWDRQQTTAAVGWVNDQFKKNQRTMRLEKREAFAAHSPFAFRYLVTEAGA